MPRRGPTLAASRRRRQPAPCRKEACNPAGKLYLEPPESWTSKPTTILNLGLTPTGTVNIPDAAGRAHSAEGDTSDHRHGA